MNELVVIGKTENSTTTRIVADSLKDGVSKKRDDGIHRNIIKIIEEKIFIGYKSIIKRLPSQANEFYECMITGARFTKTTYLYGKNNKAEMYILNEEAYHLLITHIINYKNARDINLQFIKAFKLLKQEYLTRDNKVLNEIVNKDEYGKASEVNGLPRTKQVRGYTRSKNGKELSKEINQAIEQTQLNLFTYQKEITNEK